MPARITVSTKINIQINFPNVTTLLSGYINTGSDPYRKQIKEEYSNVSNYGRIA